LLLAVPHAGAAQEDTFCAPDQAPAFAFGFADLRAFVGDAMGDPLTCEYGDPDGSGNVFQQTTTGTAQWRAATTTSIFTAGTDHWAITASGQLAWSGPAQDPPSDLVASPETPPSPGPEPAPVAPPVPELQVATPDPVVPAGQSIYWGVYIAGVPAGTAALNAYEQALGKKVSIVHWGQAWHYPDGFGTFQTVRYDTVRNRGAIPLIDWGSWDYSLGTDQPSFRLAALANGSQDAQIIQWAQGAKAWGHPFFLRFDPEMNGWWLPWSEQVNGNHSGDFVAAWRHVHDVFVQQGATNATWVWCPNIAGTRTTPLEQLYPGDDYVDWTCLDGYNWGNDNAGNHWQSFSQVFGGTAFGGNNPHNSYQEVLAIAPSKPIMIGEVASSEQGGSKAAWISDMLQVLPTAFPRINAVVWMDWNIGDPKLTWPVESSPAAQAAFASGIASPTYASNQFGGLPADRPIQPLVGVAQVQAEAQTPPPPSPPQNPAILTPVADTYTSRAAPNSTSPGSSPVLRVDAIGSDTTFLLFDLSSLEGKNVTSATLRVHTWSASYAGSAAGGSTDMPPPPHARPRRRHSPPPHLRRGPYLGGAGRPRRVTVTARPGRGQSWRPSWLGSRTVQPPPSRTSASTTLWPPVEYVEGRSGCQPHDP